MSSDFTSQKSGPRWGEGEGVILSPSLRESFWIPGVGDTKMAAAFGERGRVPLFPSLGPSLVSY